MDYMLREQERIQSRVRRYQSPDEYPFFPDALESPILAPLEYPRILHENDVNVNPVIKSRYINEILPHACKEFGREDRGETQENYGSAATADVACLQALSRRIHFGKFVAESKFRKDTEKFVKMIKAGDREGIDDAITDATVEKAVLERLRLKAKTYGMDPSKPDDELLKINVEAVVSMYKVGSYFCVAGVAGVSGVAGVAECYSDFPTAQCYSDDEDCRGRIPDAAAERHRVGEQIEKDLITDQHKHISMNKHDMLNICRALRFIFSHRSYLADDATLDE